MAINVVQRIIKRPTPEKYVSFFTLRSFNMNHCISGVWHGGNPW